MSKVTNLLVCGIGGQGVMTAAEVLSQCAIEQGFDVKKTEVAGMSQRGGVVTSHVRFGDRVYSPQIAPGEADVLLGFEAAESMRWVTHLRPEGVALVNTLELEPPVVSVGLYDYPDQPVEQMGVAGREVHAFDAGEIARELGELRLVNTVMLGAIADQLAFPAEVLLAGIEARFARKGEKVVALNREAFTRGRAAAATA